MSAQNQSNVLDSPTTARENGGYLMIDNIRIKNFRAIHDLTLSGLGRVNVIVGNNASGKTALLEGIRLGLAGTPQVLFQLNQARAQPMGFGPFMSRENFENIWTPAFCHLDPDVEIEIICHDNSGAESSLRIFFDEQRAITSIPTNPSQVATIAPSGNIVAPLPSTIAPLVLERSHFNGQKSTLTASVGPQGNFQWDQGSELGIVSEFYAANSGPNGQQAASAFSALSQKNQEREVVDAMREEFDPLIEDIVVLSPTPQNPNLFAAVPGLFREKVPLTLLSSGVNKLFIVLSSIILRGKGVVLFDEIENGFYYERLESVWRAIFRLSRKYDTQVFASTHSKECLKALAKVGKEYEGDLRLLRTEREHDLIAVSQLNGEIFEDAIEQGFEVR